jgi:circadian clock protein KaiC
LANKQRRNSEQLAKCPTGIKGLDTITEGGLPRGRPTLVTGAAGCGKTVLSMEFLVRGIRDCDDPAIFVAFEERIPELIENFKSIGFDLPRMVKDEKLILDHIEINRSEIVETGEFDLEGLFIRLGSMVDSIGAKRIVLDTLETLFVGFENEFILRSELQRLFNWIKERQLTAIITAERGKEGSLTRHGIEEYVSDCVIVLDNRMQNQISTRRLRILKYRGSPHGSNEYPFLIDSDGVSVLPVTGVGLNYRTSEERLNTGIEGLDAMLEGKGYYKGSSVLISGTAGTGKSSMAGNFVNAVCARGQKALYVAMEESFDQILRNMRSIGLDLRKWSDNGLLHFYNARPTVFGLEMHLAVLHKLILQHDPAAVVIDPISSFLTGGAQQPEVKSMLTRLIDFCKSRQTTTFFTDLIGAAEVGSEQTQEGISSLMDTWMLLRDIELNGERNRLLYVLKSRGMAHSNQVREFRITSGGIVLSDVYIGPGMVLTGSARVQQEARDKLEALTRRQEMKARQGQLERRRKSLEAQVTALQAEQTALEEEEQLLQSQQQAREQVEQTTQASLTRSRLPSVTNKSAASSKGVHND